MNNSVKRITFKKQIDRPLLIAGLLVLIIVITIGLLWRGSYSDFKSEEYNNLDFGISFSLNQGYIVSGYSDEEQMDIVIQNTNNPVSSGSISEGDYPISASVVSNHINMSLQEYIADLQSTGVLSPDVREISLDGKQAYEGIMRIDSKKMYVIYVVHNSNLIMFMNWEPLEIDSLTELEEDFQIEGIQLDTVRLY